MTPSRRHPRAATPLILTMALLLSGGAAAQSSPGADDAVNLTRAYELAVASMPTIAERRALEQAAEARVDQALSQRLPRIDADATYTDSAYETTTRSIDPSTGRPVEQLDTTNEESYRYGLNLIQPIYDREVSTGIAEARSRRTLATRETTATETRLAGQVAESYLRILRAREALRLAKAERRAYQLRVEQMQQRLARGLASRIDVLDGRVRADEARTAIVQARNELELARLDLERLTGTRIEQLLGASPERTELSRPPEASRVDALQTTAGQENPAVTVALAEQALADRTTASRRAAFFPRLSLQARYSDTNATDQLVQGEDRRIYLSLEVPLFSGGQRSAGVDEALAREQAARARTRERRRQAVIETRRLANEQRNAYERVRTARQSLETAKAQLNANEQGLDAGVRDLVEVLDARARLFGIRRDLSEATYDYLISKVQLQTVSGGFDYESLRSLDTRYLNRSIDLTKAIEADAAGRSAE